MNFDMSLCALVILCIFLQSAAVNTNKKCYKAKTCVHNNHEKCGIDGNGTPRRFLDSCDILEYNCLKETDFKKTAMEDCKHLKSLYAQPLTLNAKLNQSDEENENDLASNNFDAENPDGVDENDQVTGYVAPKNLNDDDDGENVGDGDVASENSNGDEEGNEGEGVATEYPSGDDGGNGNNGEVSSENLNGDDVGKIGDDAAPENPNGDDVGNVGDVAVPENPNGDDGKVQELQLETYGDQARMKKKMKM